MFLNLCAIHYLLTNVSVGYVSCYAKLLPRTSSLMHSRLAAQVFATVKYGVRYKIFTDICCGSCIKHRTVLRKCEQFNYVTSILPATAIWFRRFTTYVCIVKKGQAH